MGHGKSHGPVLYIILVAIVEDAILPLPTNQFGLLNHQSLQMISKKPEIAEKLEVGTVHTLIKTQRVVQIISHSGVSGSGAGVQGIKYSIEAMTNVKSIVFDVK